jgi:hypothetical protein
MDHKQESGKLLILMETNNIFNIKNNELAEEVVVHGIVETVANGMVESVNGFMIWLSILLVVLANINLNKINFKDLN